MGLNGFVGNAHHLFFNHFFSQGFGGCQVKIGENDLILSHQVILNGKGLFNLHDHMCISPDVLLVYNNLSPCLDILLIGKAASKPRVGLEQDRVAVLYEGPDAGRGYGHPFFSHLYFRGNADNHGVNLLIKKFWAPFFQWNRQFRS